MRGCLCFLFGTESRTSQMARPNPLDLTVCPTPDVMAFPLTIVPKLRPCIVHTKRFEDRVSLTIGDQNAIKSCRWSSRFYLSAVVSLFKAAELPRQTTLRRLRAACGLTAPPRSKMGVIWTEQRRQMEFHTAGTLPQLRAAARSMPRET